jgi:1-deoxy-D-xylulose-5-phosphate synthase
MRIGVPDKLVDHATPEQSMAELGLTPPQIAERVRTTFAPKLAAISK